nr:discoidin domain-containing protein [Cellvibrionaceae bacterium]
MHYLNFNNKLFVSLLASFALFGCGGGGSDDPQPQNFPQNDIKFTAADIQGSAVKGVFANAAVSVEQLNRSNLSVNASAVTDASGAFNFSVQGDRGFGLDSVAMVYVEATENATMRCDALACGLGDSLQGEQLAAVRLSSIGMLSVPFGNLSDSEADLEMQVTGLSTLASRLMLAAYEAGELNLATVELLQAAMGTYSAHILKALGVDAAGVNIFTAAVVDAATLEGLQGAFVHSTCSDDSDPNSCSDSVDTQGIKLSLVNGALSGLIGKRIVTGESCEEVEVVDDAENPGSEEQCSDIVVELTNLAEAFDLATALISQAIAAPDNASALLILAPLRQALLENFIEHPFIAELGFSAAANIIDVELNFRQAEVLSGPQQEILTEAATITARASISEAESAAQAFDNDVSTKWLDNQSVPSETDPAWVQVQFSAAQAINSVVITSANDAAERDPENFNLAGSNDGENWQILGSIAG